MNSDEMYSDSGDANHSTPRSSNRKRRISIALLAYAAFLGIICIFLPEDDQVLDLLVTLPMLILAVAWCHADANQRDHVMGGFMRISLVLLFAIAFPVYVFQTRGLSGFKTLMLTFLFGVAMFACLMATALLGDFIMCSTFGTVVEFGNDEIYYAGDATENDARKLAGVLREIEFFRSAGTSVRLESSSGQSTVSFILVENAWNDPETIGSFREIGQTVAASGYPSPLIIQLCDEYFLVKNTILIE